MSTSPSSRRFRAELENKPASSAIKWAWERFGTDIVLAASFQDCVLIDVAAKAAPGIEVVFLDTQYHFAETLWYVDRVRERYDLNLTVMQPLVSPDDLWQTDPDECCAMRKVEPLARALRGKQAWMTGLRRAESPTRTNAPIAHLDVGRGIVKVNPLATWTDADIAAYKQDHDLLEHPLDVAGLPVDRVLAVHAPRRPRRRPPFRPLVGTGQNGVRTSRVARGLTSLDGKQIRCNA